MPIDHKSKAVDINVDSLKLYITLSTISIAGLLTYNKTLNNQATDTDLFYCSLILLLFSAVCSILVVNHFIIQAHNDEFNVRTWLSRGLNWAAIILFFAGIVTGGLFMTGNDNQNHQSTIQTEYPNGILIQNNAITIGKDVKTEVVIETDSLSNAKAIYINRETK